MTWKWSRDPSGYVTECLSREDTHVTGHVDIAVSARCGERECACGVRRSGGNRICNPNGRARSPQVRLCDSTIYCPVSTLLFGEVWVGGKQEIARDPPAVGTSSLRGVQIQVGWTK